MPDDSLELARMAIEQIMCVDQLTKISQYNTEDLEESTEDKTWIISGEIDFLWSNQSNLIAPFGGVVRIEAVGGTLPNWTLFYAVKQSCRTGSTAERLRCQIGHYFERLCADFFLSARLP